MGATKLIILLLLSTSYISTAQLGQLTQTQKEIPIHSGNATDYKTIGTNLVKNINEELTPLSSTYWIVDNPKDDRFINLYKQNQNLNEIIDTARKGKNHNMTVWEIGPKILCIHKFQIYNGEFRVKSSKVYDITLIQSGALVLLKQYNKGTSIVKEKYLVLNFQKDYKGWGLLLEKYKH